MLVSGAAFTTMMTLIRIIAEEQHPLEIAFWRNVFGLLVMAPWLARVGIGGLRTHHIGGLTLRALFALTAMLCWFWAVSEMPMADATALYFTAPLFASVLAIVVLHERMGLRRSTALAAGFVGALIILRPGMIEMNFASFLAIGSALCIASSITMVKILSRTESSGAIITWFSLFLTPLSLIPALFVWQWPSWTMLAWMALLGFVATIAQIGLTRAYTVTEATVALPFDYAKLPMAAALGWIFFGETSDVWTWVGAAVMGTATVYMAHREAQIARRDRMPVPEDTAAAPLPGPGPRGSEAHPEGPDAAGDGPR